MPRVNHVQSVLIFRKTPTKRMQDLYSKKMAEIVDFWCYLTKWFTNDKGKYMH